MGEVVKEAPAAPRDWGAPLFVGAVCLAAFVNALVFIGDHGRNVPYWDDWDAVPVASGEEPLTPAFLWGLHNEHRIPLTWLTYFGLVRASGYDLRAGMFFNAVALLIASCALVLAAR